MNLIKQFPDIGNEDVEKFENKYKISLPQEYKSFLLKTNGGEPSIRKFKTRDGKITSHLMLLFPLFESVFPNLANHYATYNIGNKIPKSLLPIGEDPIKNLICISISGDDVGSIYYWSMDEEDDNYKPSFKRIKFVSESYDKFINNLIE